MNLAERWRRAVRRRRVFFAYRPEYHLGLEALVSSALVDVYRHRRVFEELLRRRLYPRARVLRPEPVSEEDLLRVHTAEYLRRLRDPAYLAEAFHLPGLMPWDADLIDPFLYQVGGTILAAERALEEGGVAVNLGGGLHHARADRAAGFCAVNDVGVAIRRLRAEGRVRRATIVDLDFHQGDGNTLLFAGDPDARILSIQAQNWVNVPAENNRDVELGFDADDEQYLDALRAWLPWAFAFPADVVFYVAGADPWIEDKLGTWKITRQGMLERDRLVLAHARRAGAPVVVVAGGGYGPESWSVYARMCEAILTEDWTCARASRAAEGGA